MSEWTQYTYVNGVLKYEPHKRTADEMVTLLAQMHFLKQAGEDISLDCETDEDWNVTVYKATRNGNLSYRFVKGE